VKASWTYEVPPAGADSAGLEEYLVETRGGEAVGKVVALLEREGERYLLLDSGAPPLAKERRAVRWDDIAEIDHETLTVTLRLDVHELASTVELDPANEVENGSAEAVRISDLPADLRPPADPESGPTDKPTYAAAIALFAAALLALLALVLAASGTDFTWEFGLFAIPAILVLAAAVAGYRSWRRPYEGSKP
jgi:hypothetical protein